MLDLIGSKGKFFSMPFDNQLLYDFFLNYTYRGFLPNATFRTWKKSH